MMMQQLTINTFHKKSQSDRIWDMLQKNDFVSTASLRLFAYQYNARIKELRELYGHDSIVACKQEGVYGIRMVKK